MTERRAVPWSQIRLKLAGEPVKLSQAGRLLMPITAEHGHDQGQLNLVLTAEEGETLSGELAALLFEQIPGAES